MLFLRFPLLASCHAPYLPHTLTMEREKSCNQRALKLFNASHLKPPPYKSSSLVLK
ncbi:hypothetical protein KVD97_00135 [Helicobacter pylori]|nr:hypothetical protein KVD97_00135 [Helicobacter pylori]